MRPETMGIATIRPTSQYSRWRFGPRIRVPWRGKRAVSKITLMSRGFTTPIADVMTIRAATTDTFRLYGRNDATPRRTVDRLIGPASGSGTVTGQWPPRRMGPGYGGPRECLPGRERHGTAQHVIQHRRRQLPRERVLLARVE